jgi:acyl-CoA synthetase (AMP-forming)/AMP-acid ligase II
MLPFRNIRDVLGLHAKVSPRKNALIYYDENQQRQSMTYLELVGKSHQVANLLYEDLGVQRGDSIAYLGANHENLLLLHCAAWVLGASLISADSPNLAQAKPKICFALYDSLEAAQAIVSQTPSIEGIIQIGGEIQENILRMEDIAAHRPTTFLGDESGAKGADIPVIEGNERSATLKDAALIFPDHSLSQGDLLLAAQSYAQAYAFTGNQSSLCALPLSESAAFIPSLFTALFTGGTAVLLREFEPALFWRVVVKERLNTTILNSQQIAALSVHALENEAQGQTIFGQKITLQDAKHFRHILCLDSQLSQPIASAFEHRFGLPIHHVYSSASRLIAAMPITLSWQQHLALSPSIGIAHAPYELSILDSSGQSLPEEAQGKLAFRINPSHAWTITNDNAFYRIGTDKQSYFFIAT